MKFATANQSSYSPTPLQPRRVHTITDRFAMTNTYIIDDERLVVVDPSSERIVRLLCDYIQHFMHRAIDDIDLIILTHLHADYTRGTEKLHLLCHAPVAAAASKRQVMAGEKILPKFGHFAGQVFSGALGHRDFLLPAATQQMKLVDIWLNDVEGLPGHMDWRVIVSPGHTPESLCLYHPFSEELLCGDTLVALEGGTLLWRSGTSRHQREETLHILRSLNIRYLYPGHGRPVLSPQPLSNVEFE